MLVLKYKNTVLWTTLLMIGGIASRKEDYVKDNIEYLGQYYAGHGEFPWVVEIRTQESEAWDKQEEWSIGNLIGPRYVLTVCDAVANFEFVGTIKDRYLVLPKNPYKYKVMYSPDFPYQGPWWYISRFAKWRQHDTRLRTGTRTVSKMKPHPYCNPNTFKYFWGMVELGAEPIKPFRNFINYAPADLDATSLFKRWYRIRHSSVWKGATLATWGKDLQDKYSKNTMLHNFKIKYAIKYLEWHECEKYASQMGWAAWNAKLEWVVNGTFCMSLIDPDNSMGAICDHDRGAPVVWEEMFVGVVITGAHYDNCSNLNPLPFVVSSLEDAQLYWTNVQRNILSYFITNKTNLFPGLTGLVISHDNSPPLPTVGALTLLIVGLLLILLQ